MLSYSIREVRRGRQAPRLRALSSASTRMGTLRASNVKKAVVDSASITMMIQAEEEYRAFLRAERDKQKRD